MIEVLTRMRLPIVPVQPDEVARLMDLAALGGVVVSATAPPSPLNGTLWFDTTSEILKMWYVDRWLYITTPEAPASLWDGGLTMWDGGATIWDHS